MVFSENHDQVETIARPIIREIEGLRPLFLFPSYFLHNSFNKYTTYIKILYKELLKRNIKKNSISGVR